MEFAIKYEKPILVIRDVKDQVPEDIPYSWLPFEKILKTSRTQIFSAYYTTEMALLMQSIRKDPTNRNNAIRFCNAEYYKTDVEVNIII